MITNRTQRSRISDELLKGIREGEFRVGEKLPSERQLAETYGVSRPVIREALGVLSTLDVIDVQMGRGAFVVTADVDAESGAEHGLRDIVDAREAIEAGALRFAAVRADEAMKAKVERAMESLRKSVERRQETSEADLALHMAIVDAAQSPLLAKLWSDMTEEIAQTIRVSPHGRSMNEKILVEHERLANGVIEGDLESALAACAELYDDHRTFLQSLLG